MNGLNEHLQYLDIMTEKTFIDIKNQLSFLVITNSNNCLVKLL